MSTEGFVAVNQALIAGSASAILSAFGAGGSIEFVDFNENVIRVVTFSGITAGAQTGANVALRLTEVVDPKTGAGVPEWSIWKNAAGSVQFRTSCGVNEGWLKLLDVIEVGVPIVFRDQAFDAPLGATGELTFTVPTEIQITRGGTHGLSQYASGGTPPYKDFTVASGVLQPGVSLNQATGVLSAAADADLTVAHGVRFQVADSSAPEPDPEEPDPYLAQKNALIAGIENLLLTV